MDSPTMTTQPSMHTRDALGRKVSLLNDEPLTHPSHHYSSSSCSSTSSSVITAAAYSSSSSSFDGYHASKKRRSMSGRSRPSSSAAASPSMPALVRADSYDSQNASSEPVSPVSPVTPHATAGFGGGRRGSGHKERDHPWEMGSDRMQLLDDLAAAEAPYRPWEAHGGRVPAPAGAAAAAAAAASRDPPRGHDHHHRRDGAMPVPVADRGPKRYSCRYRDALGCEKTFTTSGHASRHSKIHTAEKAVPCTFQGCPKKFTRNDNMKQHLETHYKDRSRSSAALKPSPVLAAHAPPALLKKGDAPRHRHRHHPAPSRSPSGREEEGEPPRAEGGRLPSSSRPADLLVDPALLSPAAVARYSGRHAAPTVAVTNHHNLPPSNPPGPQLALLSRPVAGREYRRTLNGPTNHATHAGLDVLAMAVDWRAHSQA